MRRGVRSATSSRRSLWRRIMPASTSSWAGPTRPSGRWEQARASYVSARDADGSPTRAPSSFNDTIRRVARTEGVPLLDVEQLFEAEAPHRMLGFDHFEDYVHPTPAAHGRIALALWTLLLEEGLLGEQRRAEPSVFHAAVRRPERGTASEGDDDPQMRAAQLFNLGVVLAKQGHDDQALEKFRSAAEILPSHAQTAAQHRHPARPTRA